jgi:hypothetical protein
MMFKLFIAAVLKMPVASMKGFGSPWLVVLSDIADLFQTRYPDLVITHTVTHPSQIYLDVYTALLFVLVVSPDTNVFFILGNLLKFLIRFYINEKRERSALRMALRI